MPTAIVNKFNGGMTADPRDSGSYSQLCKHFDNFTKSHSLVPYKDSEKVFNTGSPEVQTQVILRSFLMYGSTMYALGRQVATNKHLIYSNTDVSNPSWATPPNGQDDTYTSGDYKFFIEYKGVLYGSNSYGIWMYNIGTTTFTANHRQITPTAQGLVHSKDDILYVPCANVLAKNSAGSWTDAALTLPVGLTIVSLCEYGNYLAIGCSPTASGGNSIVFLWDRDSTLTTLSESIDLGAKDLKVLDNIDGYLIAISQIVGLNSSQNTKVVFSQYGGGGFITFREIELAFSSPVQIFKQKYNNRLYFVLSGATSIGGLTGDYNGVWSVGRNGENAPFSVSFSQKPNNDTIVFQILGFIVNKDYFYTSYLITNGGSDYELTKTNDQASYAVTAVYTTVINPDMSDLDKLRKKQLSSVAVTFSKLPTAGQVVLKYKVDGGSWTTVFTETTDSAQVTERQDANGVPFSFGRDYEFQIESYGGAEITGFAYSYEVISTLI